MINVYHLTDAVPTARFGIFALWAAASKRHWFVRTAVVAAALLVILLIPAYEVVVQFGVLILLVVMGLETWRRWRKRDTSRKVDYPSRHRFHMSLETLMLLTVIVAVVTAVAARAPVWSVYEWLRMIGTGAMAAALGLACVWIVCGKSPWQVRALAAPLLAVLFGALLHILMSAANVLQTGIQAPVSLSRYWEIVKRDMWHGGPYWINTSVVGTTILCTWLFLVCRAGWLDPFDEFHEKPIGSRERRRMKIARWATLSLFFLTAIFPLMLLYRLTTPTPIPAISPPKDNGFDDIVAAGQMIGPVAGTKLGRWDLISQKELGDELAKHTAAFARMREGLQKTCCNPYVYEPRNPDVDQAHFNLFNALRGEAAFARRSGNLEMQLANYCNLLRLGLKEYWGGGLVYGIFSQYERDGIRGLADCRLQLSARQCVSLAKELWMLESGRESWETRAERQRIIDENRGWESHLHVILADWSNTERHDSSRAEQLRNMAELRLLIVELALRAYALETDRLPVSLNLLVPKYMTEIPGDPYGSGGLEYAMPNEEFLLYSLYSLGPDGDDDGGRPLANLPAPRTAIF